jgi:hypothetical protein
MATERVSSQLSRQGGSDRTTGTQTGRKQQVGKQGSTRSNTGRKTGSQTNTKSGQRVSTATTQGTQQEKAAANEVSTSLPHTTVQRQLPSKQRSIATEDYGIQCSVVIQYGTGVIAPRTPLPPRA